SQTLARSTLFCRKRIHRAWRDYRPDRLKQKRVDMIGVRKYVEGDREAIQEICYLTGYMGDSAERFWRHKESFVEMWTSYYIDQEPESVYVATIDEAVVGYLTGCMDTSLATLSIHAQIIKYGLLFRPGTAGFLWRGIIDSIRDKQVAR